MPSIIELEGVDFQYPGRRKIFSGLNLSLEKGEILGLIGPNSSGKTTLLKLADGLLQPQRGKVLLDGEDLNRLSRSRVARYVAVVPQAMEVPFSFRGAEIVLMGRAPYLGRFGWEKQKDLEVAREAMVLTDVDDLGNRPFWELSQGEKQRVLIARALAQEPKVILLDEPTSHLDINHQVEIHELIRRLNSERNLTVLHVSHDLNLAAEYCHRMILLHRGSIFSMGTPSSVITEENIRRVYQAKVSVEKNPLSGAPRVTPLGRSKWENTGPRKAIHLICGEGSGVDSARRLLLRGYRISMGVLNIGDTDQQVGKSLGIPMALEEPFSPISGRALEENRRLIAGADLVVVERFHIGIGNLANLQAGLDAREMGKGVIVLENDLEYDFSGGEAKEAYRRLRERGAVFIPDHSQLLEAIEKAGTG
jgi:iron complex transport system ATP-binding protein